MTLEELEGRLRDRPMPSLSPELRSRVLDPSHSWQAFLFGLAIALFMGWNLSLLIAQLPMITFDHPAQALTSLQPLMEIP